MLFVMLLVNVSFFDNLFQKVYEEPDPLIELLTDTYVFIRFYASIHSCKAYYQLLVYRNECCKSSEACGLITGSYLKHDSTKSVNSFDILPGNLGLYSFCFIIFRKRSLFFENSWKGGLETSISMMQQPKLQISAALPYWLCSKTSGACQQILLSSTWIWGYCWLVQFMLWISLWEVPKSDNFIMPLLSIKRLEQFKSI